MGRGGKVEGGEGVVIGGGSCACVCACVSVGGGCAVRCAFIILLRESVSETGIYVATNAHLPVSEPVSINRCLFICFVQ